MNNIKLKEYPQEYMKKIYPDTYGQVNKALIKLSSKELQTRLNDYYLKRMKYVYYYKRDYIEGYSNYFCNCINEINNPEIEYYLEYCLEFYEEYFEIFLKAIRLICIQVKYALKEINANYLRFIGEKDIEELLKRICSIVPNTGNKDLDKCVNSIISSSKELVLKHYQQVSDGNNSSEIGTGSQKNLLHVIDK